jgi:hypothetical protein
LGFSVIVGSGVLGLVTLNNCADAGEKALADRKSALENADISVDFKNFMV